MGWLHPKGVPFFLRLQGYKIEEISQVEVYEWVAKEVCHLVILKGLQLKYFQTDAPYG